MKKMVLVVTLAAVAVAFSGCKKKEPTLSERAAAAVKSGEKAAKDAAKEAEKAGADLSKKLDNALKK